jgi:hypothetical protein
MGLGVFQTVEIVHFSSFVVLNVCHAWRMLAGKAAAGAPSQPAHAVFICCPGDMVLAVGTWNLGLEAGQMEETLT